MPPQNAGSLKPELSEETRGSLSLGTWVAVIIAILGWGATYGVMQVRTADNTEAVAKNAERISEVERECMRRIADSNKEFWTVFQANQEAVRARFDKLTQDNNTIRLEISNRSEQDAKIAADNNTRIGVLTEKVSQANTSIEKLGASIEKLADQIRRDRDERRTTDR